MSEPNDRGRVVSDEERAKAMLEQLKGVHAVDIGRDMVIATVNFSYPKLGLSDETRPVRDLDDVRVSIELIRAILEVLEREHAGEKTSDLHDTLAQMQLAYAHAVQLANAERAASAAPEPQSEPAAEKEPARREGAGAPRRSRRRRGEGAGGRRRSRRPRRSRRAARRRRRRRSLQRRSPRPRESRPRRRSRPATADQPPKAS